LSSAPRGPTVGDPARGAPAGPVPAAGARAADELGAQGAHCRWSGSRCSGGGAGACGWRPGCWWARCHRWWGYNLGWRSAATGGGLRYQDLHSPVSEVFWLVRRPVRQPLGARSWTKPPTVVGACRWHSGYHLAVCSGEGR